MRESRQNPKYEKSAGQDRNYPDFLKFVPRSLVEVLKRFATWFQMQKLSLMIGQLYVETMTDPNNYWRLSLINCIGVFSSIISNRNKHYLDLTNRIGWEQTG